MNPLNNHRHSLILGIVIALVLALAIGGFHFNPLGLARWFHIVAGVFWIGLLYYFNVAQTPALADAAADKGGPGGAGITKYVAPRALFWFRWAALATWLGGAWLLGPKFVPAFTLGAGVEIHALLLRISPEIRYEGFAFRTFNSIGDALQSNRNQALFLVGISF